ncbi:MAG: hypothetical protein WBV06_16960, partial [Acidimicrobiia bacterium]
MRDHVIFLDLARRHTPSSGLAGHLVRGDHSTTPKSAAGLVPLGRNPSDETGLRDLGRAGGSTTADAIHAS